MRHREGSQSLRAQRADRVAARDAACRPPRRGNSDRQQQRGNPGEDRDIQRRREHRGDGPNAISQPARAPAPTMSRWSPHELRDEPPCRGAERQVHASESIKSFLFGVNTRDLATFASVPCVLATGALPACYLPARRGMKVDPMVALRDS